MSTQRKDHVSVIGSDKGNIRRSVVRGLLDGFSAPSSLFSGELEILSEPKITTISDVWANVGKRIDAGTRAYGIKNPIIKR